MEFEHIEPVIIPEKRLVHTFISGKPHKLSLVAALGGILFMALFTQFYWQNIFGWAEFLPAVPQKVFQEGQWWRVFTATFIHGDLGHFISNMALLGVFSFLIFGYFGFMAYPLLSFLLSGVINTLALWTYAPEVRLLGASGMVYMLGGFWLILFFLIQRQYNIFNRLLRIMGVGFMLFLPTTFEPSTSYRTHAIGFIVGVLFGLAYFLKNKEKIRALEIYEVSYVEGDPTFH